MKKLYILALLFLMPLCGGMNAMECDISEGKQEIEEVEKFGQLDLLSFVKNLPAEMRMLVWSYIINADSIDELYKNIRSLLSIDKQSASLFKDNEFIASLVDFSYEKFIIPAHQLTDAEKEEHFDRALTLALAFKNNVYSLQKIKEWLKDIGQEEAQKEFLSKQMIEKVKNSALKKVDFLVDYIDPALVNATDVENPSKPTALIIAINRNDKDMIVYLVEHKADVNAIDILEKTPLITAVINVKVNAGLKDLVKYLVTHGADVNSAEKSHKRTALMIAASKGYLPVVEYLIQHGADITFLDDFEKTARDIAQEQGHEDIVAILDKAAKKQKEQAQ